MSSFKLLAHGDSITKGYYNMGFKYHSYTIQLKKLLDAKFNGQREVIITEQGVNGEKTEDMLERLKWTLGINDSSEQKKTYDCVVILGGLNDLAYLNYWTPEDIAKNLCEMYRVALGHVSNCVIGVTVPICVPDKTSDKYRTGKQAVNRIISEYVSKYQQSPTDNKSLYLVDLSSNGIDYLQMSEKERSEVFDDYIHYKPEGYNRLGSAIFRELEKHI